MGHRAAKSLSVKLPFFEHPKLKSFGKAGTLSLNLLKYSRLPDAFFQHYYLLLLFGIRNWRCGAPF